MKELIVQSFTFLKYNLVQGKPVSQALQHYYTATLRVVLILLKDYQNFLTEFHFNFVNSLPEHAIQMRNMILAAFPKGKNPPSPFQHDLKVDTIDVEEPKIMSNFEVYLSMNNLKSDLDNYFKSKSSQLLNEVCNKMMASKENINGRMVPSSSVINAVVLYIAIQTCSESHQDSAKKQKLEMFKQIATKLDD